MLKYQITVIKYEFRTKQGEEWSSEDILTAFYNESSYEGYEVAGFINYNDAKAYVEENLRAPSEHKVAVGYVIEGEIYELTEYGEDEDDIVNTEYFAKGNN